MAKEVLLSGHLKKRLTNDKIEVQSRTVGELISELVIKCPDFEHYISSSAVCIKKKLKQQPSVKIELFPKFGDEDILMSRFVKKNIPEYSDYSDIFSLSTISDRELPESCEIIIIPAISGG